MDKIDNLIKEETRKRCKIIDLDEKTNKKYTNISTEFFHFLYEVNSIDFNIYFRIDNVLIEFIRKEEFSKKYLDLLWNAMQKSDRRLEICLLKSEKAAFDKIIETIKENKIKNLIKKDPSLDKKTIKIFSDLSEVSQLIVRGGITKDVAEKVVNSANYIVSNLMDNNTAIATLSRMVTHDPTLYDHSASVSMLAGVIAMQCLNKELPRKEIEIITKAGLYHDVGKTCVPSAILNKPGKFTPDEFAVMKKHAQYGEEELLKSIAAGAPVDRIAARVAGEHHERINGQGYPNGKQGRDEEVNNGIHLYSRIIMIADVYSALLMRRVYKPSYEAQDAIKIMSEIGPREFDMDIFSNFVRQVVNSLNAYQERAKMKGKGRILFFDDNGTLHEK